MSGSYRVEPGPLRATARGFTAAGDHLQTAGRALGGALDSAGPCWGGDEAGAKFASGYVPAADNTRQAITAFADALREVDRQLNVVADTYESADQGWADGFGGGAG